MDELFTMVPWIVSMTNINHCCDSFSIAEIKMKKIQFVIALLTVSYISHKAVLLQYCSCYIVIP